MNSAHHARVRVGSPAALLTAIPAMLGFIPERSLILLAHDDLSDRIGALARVDYETDAAGRPTEQCRRGVGAAAALLRHADAEDLLVVLVHDDDPGGSLTAVRELVTAQLRGGDRFVEILDVFAVPEFAEGATWACGHGASGRLADPRTCAAAVAALVAGRTISDSRGSLLAELAEQGPGIAERACRAAVPAGTADADLLREMLAAIALDGPLSDGAVRRLGGALLRLDVRDAVIALALTAAAGPAHERLCELARRLRGSPRAGAATVVAALSYIRGDGPTLGIALAAALAADCHYRAARLLEQAFEAGLRPGQMADLADVGARVAARLGVELPPFEQDAAVG